jgi:uncharacterized protein (TIGR02598 family)
MKTKVMQPLKLSCALVVRCSSLQRRMRGFSLVEVALAVAIAAVGLVAVLGVLPTSMASVRDAGNLSAKARIIGEILGELQLSDWGAVSGNGKTSSEKSSGWNGLDKVIDRRWYFDDQANPISESDSDFDSQLSFVARVRLSTDPVSVPGDAAGSSNLKNVQIDIAVIPDKDFKFSDSQKNVFSTYPGIISRRYSSK